MSQNTENKIEIKDRTISFFRANKTKIYVFILILVTALATFIFLKASNEKKNLAVAEKYVNAAIYLSVKENGKAEKLYKEIILSENNFYSVLALNTIVEKSLISNKKKIIEYFDILENSISDKRDKELLMFKKALYLIKNLEIEDGKNLLKTLIDDNSNLKPIALELIKD